MVELGLSNWRYPPIRSGQAVSSAGPQPLLALRRQHCRSVCKGIAPGAVAGRDFHQPDETYPAGNKHVQVKTSIVPNLNQKYVEMDINQEIPWDFPIAKHPQADFHPQFQTSEGLRMRLGVAVCFLPASRLRCFIFCNIYRIGDCVSDDDDDDEEEEEEDEDEDEDDDDLVGIIDTITRIMITVGYYQYISI